MVTNGLTKNDAIKYLKEVKEKYKLEEREKNDEFIQIMKDYKAQKFDIYGVVSKVKEVFKEHHDLIVGLNMFLPMNYDINIFLKKRDPDFEEALRFVSKVKTRFAGEDGAYRSFLEILHTFGKKDKPLTAIHHEAY